MGQYYQPITDIHVLPSGPSGGEKATVAERVVHANWSINRLIGTAFSSSLLMLSRVSHTRRRRRCLNAIVS